METNLMELVDSCNKSEDFYGKTDENLERASYLENLGFNHLAKELMEKVTLKEKLNQISLAGYLKITTANIEKYLDKKVELYNAKNEVKTEKKLADEITFWATNPFSGAGITFDQMQNALAQSLGSRRYYNAFTGIATVDSDDNKYAQMVEGRQFLLPENFFNHTSTPTRIVKQTCDYHKTTGIGKYEWQETRIEEYKAIPPQDALNRLAEEKQKNLFDYYTIAQVNEIKDPLLLGKVNGSDDRFFIAQWGDDIALEDVI